MYIAKLAIFRGLHKQLEKNLHIIDAEDAAIAHATDLAGGQELDVAPAAVVVVAQRHGAVEAQDGAVALPERERHRVAGVQDVPGGGYVY